MSNQSYKQGKRWGYAIFKSNLELFGKQGLHKSDAAMTTCSRYAKDRSLKKTKNGKVLDERTRAGYRGVSDGIYEAWRKFESKYDRR